MSAKSRKPVEVPPERPLKQTAIDILASEYKLFE
jgi:hypothetical protein